jgi:hypothetical protein
VRWQVTLPTNQATGMFRLFQTNEAPIRYPARIQWNIHPDAPFLDHQSAVVLSANMTTVNRSFSAYAFADGPGDVVTFACLDANSGRLLTPVRSFQIAQQIGSYPYPNTISYFTTPDSGDIEFSPGQYQITLVISDDFNSFTNNVRFDVLSFDTALQEFLAAVQALATFRNGRIAASFVERALRAAERGHEKLAAQRWRHFQRQLQRVTSLSEEERGKLSSAASQIQPLMQIK